MTLENHYFFTPKFGSLSILHVKWHFLQLFQIANAIFLLFVRKIYHIYQTVDLGHKKPKFNFFGFYKPQKNFGEILVQKSGGKSRF